MGKNGQSGTIMRGRGGFAGQILANGARLRPSACESGLENDGRAWSIRGENDGDVDEAVDGPAPRFR